MRRVAHRRDLDDNRPLQLKDVVAAEQVDPPCTLVGLLVVERVEVRLPGDLCHIEAYVRKHRRGVRIIEQRVIESPASRAGCQDPDLRKLQPRSLTPAVRSIK